MSAVTHYTAEEAAGAFGEDPELARAHRDAGDWYRMYLAAKGELDAERHAARQLQHAVDAAARFVAAFDRGSYMLALDMDSLVALKELRVSLKICKATEDEAGADIAF